jgi:hypothetical protein
VRNKKGRFGVLFFFIYCHGKTDIILTIIFPDQAQDNITKKRAHNCPALQIDDNSVTKQHLLSSLEKLIDCSNPFPIHSIAMLIYPIGMG